MNQRWKPRGRTETERVSLTAHCLKYTKELEAKGRFQLTIWPEHCIVGSKGHAVVDEINDSLQLWAKETQRTVQYIQKAQNRFTEMYSGIEAEVVMEDDDMTRTNKELLSRLKIADQLIICGQAKSHCVNFTTRDIVKHWHKENERVCILNDACSNVAFCEKAGDAFIRDMQKEGVSIRTTEDVFQLYLGEEA